MSNVLCQILLIFWTNVCMHVFVHDIKFVIRDWNGSIFYHMYSVIMFNYLEWLHVIILWFWLSETRNRYSCCSKQLDCMVFLLLIQGSILTLLYLQKNTSLIAVYFLRTKSCLSIFSEKVRVLWNASKCNVITKFIIKIKYLIELKFKKKFYHTVSQPFVTRTRFLSQIFPNGDKILLKWFATFATYITSIY